MHLKKSQILLPRKSCSAPSFYPSSFSFLQRGGRPSSLWEWNERGSWRDKRLGCCHWEIIDPRTLPICTKNALNNRIKKVRHHGNQKHLARIDHQFSHKGMKSEPFSVQWTARMHTRKKEKSFNFLRGFLCRFSAKEKKSESCSSAPCQNGTRHNPILWHFFAAQKLHRNSASVLSSTKVTFIYIILDVNINVDLFTVSKQAFTK